jgi:hypothetical protein
MREHLEAVEQFTALYARARQAHPALPALEELDAEWDILETVSREKHFPRNAEMYARWYVLRAVNSWAGYLHEFILPTPHNAVALEEYNYFDDKEKERIIGVLNWIMYCNREANLLQLDEDDAKTAEFIARVLVQWRERKPVLRETLTKNTAIWREKAMGRKG